MRDAILDTSRVRSWRVHALHVRTNHVHGVVDSELPGSRVIHDWKAYAPRALRSAGLVSAERIIWTHVGAVQLIRSNEHLRLAIRYVLDRQGEPMAYYAAEQ